MRTNAAPLRGALRVLKQLIIEKPVMPVLGHIRLEIREGQLSVEATNVDTCVRFLMPAVGDLAPVLLPFRRFSALLDAAGARKGDVGIAVSGRRVSVTVTGRSFSLESGISPDDFPPPIQQPEAPKPVVYDNPTELAVALDWLLPAVSSDPTRPMLTGLCLDGNKVTACDGHRLHQVSGLPALDGGTLLPAPAGRTLLAFLKTFKPKSVEGAQADGTFGFQSALAEVSFLMTSRSSEVEPPDYTEVIPKSDKTAAEVSVEQLDAALNLAAKVAGSGHAKLQLNGALFVEACDLDDGGSVREEVEAQRVHGDAEVEVGIDLGYLRDALTATSPTAVIGLTDEMAPLTVRFPDDESRLAVVMPLRL